MRIIGVVVLSVLAIGVTAGWVAARDEDYGVPALTDAEIHDWEVHICERMKYAASHGLPIPSDTLIWWDGHEHVSMKRNCGSA